MNLKLWHNTRSIFICLLIVFFSMNLLGTPQSFAMQATPEKSAMNFEDYFKRVIEYGVYPLWDFERMSYKETIRYSGIEDKYEGSLADVQTIVQNLIKLTPSLSHFYDKMEHSPHTYLEILFGVNFGWLAEEICSKIKETKEKLPEEYEILLKIYRGESPENNFSTYSVDFINLAYKVANNTKNINMVKKLYPLSGVEEKEAALKKSNPEIYSPEMNYIHEPYWSYNLIQLQDYGERIIDKISPYFVKKRFKNGQSVAKLKQDNGKEITYVAASDGAIQVRQVSFGYVLPNLYLKKRLADENDQTRAVARIFLVPKKKDVKFTFKMPYTEFGIDMDTKKLQYITTSDNPLQVLSEDFVVYQEWIGGEGKRGNREFIDLGHRDFNAPQIIKSYGDDKSYLIDTKEEKNFFVPYFSPFEDDFTKDKKFPYQDYGIKDNQTFKKWKEKNQAVVYDAKMLHFDPRVIFVDVTVHIEK